MDNSVTVIVCTYNREDLLMDSINDILDQRYEDMEVLVVDQSRTHTKEVDQYLTEKHEHGAIRLLKSDTPGLTRARNLGLRESRGSSVVYIDDDVRIPDRDFVKAHVDALKKPEIGAVAGRILEPDRPPLVVSSRIGWMGYWGTREPGFGSAWSGPADSVRGCNMSFRREVLMDIGGFDESYTKSAFREDTDVALRIRRQGYKLWFSADAWLYHLSAQSGGTRDQSIDVAYDLILNDLRFATKNLLGVQRQLWIMRLYGSRVVKAGLKSGGLRERHRSYRRAIDEIGAQRRRHS